MLFKSRNEFSPASSRKGSQEDSKNKRGFDRPLLALRWRWPCSKECKHPLHERRFLLIANRETGTSVLQPQGIKLCQ